MIVPTVEAPIEANSTAALPISSALPTCGLFCRVTAFAIDSRALLNISATSTPVMHNSSRHHSIRLTRIAAAAAITATAATKCTKKLF